MGFLFHLYHPLPPTQTFLYAVLCCVAKQEIKEIDWDEKSLVCLIIPVYILVLYSSLQEDI